jgi:hypothetical protein
MTYNRAPGPIALWKAYKIPGMVPPGQKAHGSRWSAFRVAHKDHNESSHFSSSPSLLHALLRSDDTEDVTGGRQAATAAILGYGNDSRQSGPFEDFADRPLNAHLDASFIFNHLDTMNVVQTSPL